MLRHCWIRLNATFQKRLRGIGLTPDQYIALRWIEESLGHEISQAQLAQLMYTDANTVSSLLSRMEKLGLIKRKVSGKDGRKKALLSSSLGKAKFKEAKPIAESLQEALFSGFDDKEKKDFRELLSRLNRFLNPNP